VAKSGAGHQQQHYQRESRAEHWVGVFPIGAVVESAAFCAALQGTTGESPPGLVTPTSRSLLTIAFLQ